MGCDGGCTVRICQGTGCVSAGSRKLTEALQTEIDARGLDDVEIKRTGCHGFCERGPIVVTDPDGIFYSAVQPDDAPDVADALADEGRVERLLYRDPTSDEPIPHYDDIPFYKGQQQLILRNCGIIDPENIDEAIDREAYQALQKAFASMSPEDVIEEVTESGLRGRGGAGFPTGVKWGFARKAEGDEKYVICNADEGDPGAFMDRSILEADPHAVIEGMAIAAYAIGAHQGYIYVRAEYPLAVERLRIALRQARERGFLGDNILGGDFKFDIRIFEGAGAFVCGEETALIKSIEGHRGMPDPRPPFPANSGLWGKPTNINNVKSYATVPAILRKGADWYSAIGTENSKGTAVFSVTGKVLNSGLIEVPMGTTLADIIYEIGGGIPGNKKFKAVQIGGPSGGCLPAGMLNTPVDFDSLTDAGAMMGSGGMVVMDEDTCAVDLARYFLDFTQKESCGKCAPCRLGTKDLLDRLTKISAGIGTVDDLDELEALAKSVKVGSLCGLGQTAPNPVLTTLRYFRDEYEEHLRMKRCRAAACAGLVSAPCKHSCPAGIDVPRYVRLVAAGKYADALAVVRERIPFPSVCGLVCFHPCEAKCRRALIDDAISIRALKRTAAEHDDGRWKEGARTEPSTGKRVAIVGSGPAGLTAGYYLARKGHDVTAFEEFPDPGGMMRYGIPDYRLPKDVLTDEIDEITNAGVKVETQRKVQSTQELFEAGFDAVFLSLGAHRGVHLGIEGEEEVGVLDCIDFLRRVKLGFEVDLGERVAVIGGGNSAIDAARTALRLAGGADPSAPDPDQPVLDASRTAKRLGAQKVTILYRRTRGEMPADEEEVRAAMEEGIDMEFLTMPTRIATENGDIRIDCTRMQLGEFDASGRRRPQPIPDSEFSMYFDRIISAIGETPDIPEGFQLATTKWNTLQPDPLTLETEQAGVYAGGDVASGPASVIEAIAAGRRAAGSIDRYLGGDGDIGETLIDPSIDYPFETEEGERPRIPVPTRTLDERVSGFREVELGYSDEDAQREALRCLNCDLEED